MVTIVCYDDDKKMCWYHYCFHYDCYEYHILTLSCYSRYD